MNKKLIIANIISFLIFLVLFILQWFILKTENPYFLLVFLCVLSFSGILFIVLSIINMIMYIKDLHHNIQNMEKNFASKNNFFDKK